MTELLIGDAICAGLSLARRRAFGARVRRDVLVRRHASCDG
jgi:hypothetical protein